MSDQQSTRAAGPDIDVPSAVAAVFDSEEQGFRALEQLRAAGDKKAWLGITRAQKDGKAFSELVDQHGGGKLDEFARVFSGAGDESLYKALTDHGISVDVARALAADMPASGGVVVASCNGDVAAAARALEAAGGQVKGASNGAHTAAEARPRLPDATNAPLP